MCQCKTSFLLIRFTSIFIVESELKTKFCKKEKFKLVYYRSQIVNCQSMLTLILSIYIDIRKTMETEDDIKLISCLIDVLIKQTVLPVG